MSLWLAGVIPDIGDLFNSVARLGPTPTTMLFVTAFLAGGVYALRTFRRPPAPTEQPAEVHP